MTVSATENRKEHAGNGVTTAFATPVFFNESDVVAYLVNDTTGASTQWTLNTEYTLSGAGNASGGTLTVDTSPTDYTPASGETLVVITDPTYDQGVDLVNNDALDAEVLEQALDELTVMIQRVDSKIGRAFRFSDDAAGTDSVSIDIPTPEASKALRWNSDGDALENVNLSDVGVIATTDFTETLLDDADAPTALSTLGFSSFAKTLIDDADSAEARKTLGADSQKRIATITMSDEDYTLSDTENAAEFKVVDMSACSTTRQLICDDVTRKSTFIVTGGQTATVTTSGTTPTTVDVPSGTTADVVVLAGVGADFASYPVLDEDAMTSDSASAVPTQQSVKAYVDGKYPLFHAQDQKTTGTDAGGSSIGNVIRTLNVTHVNEITGASRSGNQITLPAGTYYVEAKAPGYDTGNHKIRLYNATDATYFSDVHGTSENTQGGSGVQTSSFAYGRFTLAAQKTIELRHYFSGSKGTNGLGLAASSGDPEVYADLRIWKVS